MAETEPLEELRELVASHPLLRAAAADPVARRLVLVGGCVRDALMGRPLKDLDCAGDLEALEALLALARDMRITRVDLDPERRTHRLVPRGALEVDVTLLREGELEEDLRARDLTINALAFPLSGEGLVDPTGGRADLEAELLRVPGPGVLDDDPLRTVRVLRFAATLGFEVDPATLAGLARVAHRSGQPAGERRVAELRKLLEGPRWQDAWAAGLETGVLPAALGKAPEREVAAVAEVERALARLPVPRPLKEGPRRLLLLTAGEDGDGPDLPLERAEARWLRGFAAARGQWRERIEAGDGVLLPWFWGLGAGTEGALVRGLLEPGGPERLQAAALVPRPETCLDGKDLMRELEVAPGPEIRRLLDRLAVAQARGRVRGEQDAWELVRNAASR